jgi:Ca2+-binding RTX toxin-like protein
MYRANRIQISSSVRPCVRSVTTLNRAVDSTFEPLESRRLYSVTATAAAGVLTVTGDGNANVITVSRDAGGKILVNNGAVSIAGSTATVTNTAMVKVFGSGGNDNIALDETRGALPKASLSGGDGNDTLTGGSGTDILIGEAGNDFLLGKAGNDQLFGGSGNDTLTGGVGTDQAFGQAGNDRMIWNPGDGSDLNEGGDGADTVEVNGGDVAEAFTVDAVGARVLFKRVDPGPFTIDIGTSESLVLNAKGGNDTFAGGTGLAGKIAFTVDGGAGNDSLLGTDGNDRLLGGDGDDFIDGNAGADIALLGAGNDTFRWDPGDGSDVVEGGVGTDDMLFNGAKINENIDLSANNGRLRFFREAGNITMDVNDTEVVRFNRLGGADKVTVHNLAGTEVKDVILNLAAPVGLVGGDGATQSVIVEGTSGADRATVASSVRGIAVAGLAAIVDVTGADRDDKLTINTLGGNDLVNAVALAANLIQITADGGSGNDVIVGSLGNDTLLGGDGDDILIGIAGSDVLNGGAGQNILL